MKLRIVNACNRPKGKNGAEVHLMMDLEMSARQMRDELKKMIQ